jgi:hypothetical protein
MELVTTVEQNIYLVKVGVQWMVRGGCWFTVAHWWGLVHFDGWPDGGTSSPWAFRRTYPNAAGPQHRPRSTRDVSSSSWKEEPRKMRNPCVRLLSIESHVWNQFLIFVSLQLFAPEQLFFSRTPNPSRNFFVSIHTASKKRYSFGIDVV